MTSTYPRFDGTQACADPTPQQRASFEGTITPTPARELCPACRFLAPCRTYALEHDVTGVWGELDDDERRKTRRSQGRPEPVPVTDELDELVRVWRTGQEPAPDATADRDRQRAS